MKLRNWGKATQFEKVSHFFKNYIAMSKQRGFLFKISVAFTEYLNFKQLRNHACTYYLLGSSSQFLIWYYVCNLYKQNREKLKFINLSKKLGGAGYRSRYLSHAKRALYHLSYAPILIVQELSIFSDATYLLTDLLTDLEDFHLINFTGVPRNLLAVLS